MTDSQSESLPAAKSPADSGDDLRSGSRFVRSLAGLRLIGILTLASRVLGMVRDIGMATLFGNGVILDAFTVAFRIPNLARRLFGEGALTAAFLPEFVRESNRAGLAAAWTLTTAVLVQLARVLVVICLIAETVLVGLWWSGVAGPATGLLLGLTAILLPYLIAICLAAFFSAVLHAMGNFLWPALLPILLNLIWIAAIWLAAPLVETPEAKIHLIAVCIVIGGVVQLMTPLPKLRRFGYRFVSDWRTATPRVRAIAAAMIPILLGLSVTQLNTLLDSLIAWGFSSPIDSPVSGEQVTSLRYPLRSGTAAALYLGQRLYQFPLGVFGVSLGTVLFPQFARHAAQKRFDLLSHDLTWGLRLVLAVGLPASAGLMLLASPLTSLLFEYGRFDRDDARQTAGMIFAYGSGVWAYCGLLIVHRGYYAIGDRRTPVRVGLVAVGVNIGLNFALMWWLSGAGLALATALAAMFQVAVLTALITRNGITVDWPEFNSTLLRALVATAVMALACAATSGLISSIDALPAARFLRVACPLAVSVLTYGAAAWILGMPELRLLLHRKPEPEPEE